MLIFKESGRLGNQIFQYAALRSLCKDKEELLLLGFDDLQATFDGIDAKIINSNSSIFEKKIHEKFYYPLLDVFSEKGLISRISEKNDRVYGLVQNKGAIDSIKFIQKSYFQNENLFCQKVIKNLVFKSISLVKKNIVFNEISPSKTILFVHVRRGDYLTWQSKDKPAVLPASYYMKCIDLIYSKISNPFFIFTSDDPFYVEDIFGDIDSSYISRGSSIEDFVLMSHCHGGILSASSFSWWAAYFSKLQHVDSIFLAPNYWVGHRLKSWDPPFIKSSFLEYINV